MPSKVKFDRPSVNYVRPTRKQKISNFSKILLNLSIVNTIKPSMLEMGGGWG